MSTAVTLRGRLTRDPEMRYTANGKAVTTFAVVTSRRVKDDAGNWSDRDTTFWDCVSFGPQAENVASSLEKGTAVIVVGNAYQEEWEARDGTKRRSLKVTVDEVAPSLRWASAKIVQAERSTGQRSQQADPTARPADDPWAEDSPPF